MTDYMTTPGAALTSNERKLLYNISKWVAEKFLRPRILNIGVEYGASVHCLRAGGEKATLYAVDLSTTKFVGSRDNINFIEQNSHGDKISALVRAPLHLVFVDGDHSYDGVLADASLWGPKVVSGGYMLFHDYNNIQTMEILREQIKDVGPAVEHWFTTVQQEADNWTRLQTVDSIGVFTKK